MVKTLVIISVVLLTLGIWGFVTLPHPTPEYHQPSWAEFYPYRFNDGKIGWVYQVILPPKLVNHSSKLVVPNDVNISSCFLRELGEAYWHPSAIKYEEDGPQVYREAPDGTSSFYPHKANLICRNMSPYRRYAIVVLLRENN